MFVQLSVKNININKNVCSIPYYFSQSCKSWYSTVCEVAMKRPDDSKQYILVILLCLFQNCLFIILSECDYYTIELICLFTSFEVILRLNAEFKFEIIFSTFLKHITKDYPYYVWERFCDFFQRCFIFVMQGFITFPAISSIAILLNVKLLYPKHWE